MLSDIQSIGLRQDYKMNDNLSIQDAKSKNYIPSFQNSEREFQSQREAARAIQLENTIRLVVAAVIGAAYFGWMFGVNHGKPGIPGEEMLKNFLGL